MPMRSLFASGPRSGVLNECSRQGQGWCQLSENQNTTVLERARVESSRVESSRAELGQNLCTCSESQSVVATALQLESRMSTRYMYEMFVWDLPATG
mmetsp:Transcript_6660/g.14038  ORF Transcript_6660/g.14038 Transcript_6660/m.14038 type:complete len:97 (-) Transcript_6660:119-409(-)